MAKDERLPTTSRSRKDVQRTKQQLNNKTYPEYWFAISIRIGNESIQTLTPTLGESQRFLMQWRFYTMHLLRLLALWSKLAWNGLRFMFQATRVDDWAAMQLFFAPKSDMVSQNSMQLWEKQNRLKPMSNTITTAHEASNSFALVSTEEISAQGFVMCAISNQDRDFTSRRILVLVAPSPSITLPFVLSLS